MSLWILALSLLLPAACRAHGAPRRFNLPPTPRGIVAHAVPYECLGRAYTGYVAMPAPTEAAADDDADDANDADDETARFLPAVLVGHTWTGLGDMERYRTTQMASRGFVAFALDVYGTGVRPATEPEARGNMSKVESNVTDFYARLDCGLQQLLDTVEGDVRVNASQLFANGYCFGGQMVLELARRRVQNLRAVSSFHGELSNLRPNRTDAGITAVVQVHHASLDYQGDQGLQAFEDEMRALTVEHWSTSKYGSNVSHGWTDPTSMNYRPFYAEQSHSAMFRLYDQLLSEEAGGETE